MLRKQYRVLGFALVTFIMIVSTVQAQTRPIQISLINPIQIFPEKTHILGLRLNLLYGKNASVTGLDVGLVNHMTKGQSGGVQFGFLGIVESDFTGWQDNTINITKKKFVGLQAGIVNSARYMNGIQFGLVNYAENMKGLQIGLINIIRRGGAFPVFPIINWSF